MLALALPSKAQADVSVDPAFTVLYVKGDEAPNQIAIECLGGLVYVNGAAAADGKASCSDLEKLHVFGFGGDDVITLGGFGVDLTGEAGQAFDEYGNQQSISVNGGDGNDVLKGDALQEEFNGGAGDDVLSGQGALASFMSGGPGNDRLRGSFLISFMSGGPGTDRMRGGGVVTFGLGGGGADTYVGGSHFDFADGGKGRDKLAGKGGRDLLAGQAGADELFGGAGRDVLGGGPGRDALHGGPGRDREFQGGLPRHLGHLPGISKILDASSEQSQIAFPKLRKLVPQPGWALTASAARAGPW
jgi:Ca2+-binding RTX toxin-like protein